MTMPAEKNIAPIIDEISGEAGTCDADYAFQLAAAEMILRTRDALEAAEAQLAACRDSENGALEWCNVLQHQLAAERERAERAERAERERDALLIIAERYAPCPFALYPDSARSLYKEDCATCQPKKKERLACLLEWAAAEAAKEGA